MPFRTLLLIASVICFVVALLLTLGAFSGGNETAWVDGGALSFVLSFLVP